MPIASRADYRHYLAEDLRAHGVRRYSLHARLTRPTLHYQRRLRHVEYVWNCRRGALWKPYVLFLRWRLRQLGVRMGFDIPPNVFGPGLYVVHWGTITVSDAARVGANCRIHPSSCIGHFDGGAPTLGDDVYIGPGAKLFGPIRIGDRVRIGANAVVNRSFPDGVTIAGVPARVIGPAA